MILTEQPPATSAVFRALFPEDYDRDKSLDRLEAIAVTLVRGQMLLGKQVEVNDRDLPTKWSDIWTTPEEPRADDSRLMSFEEIDQRMGWRREIEQITAPPEGMTFEDVDERMGW